MFLVDGWGYVDVFVALNSDAKVRRGDCGLRMMVKIICKRLRVKRKRWRPDEGNGGTLRWGNQRGTLSQAKPADTLLSKSNEKSMRRV